MIKIIHSASTSPQPVGAPGADARWTEVPQDEFFRVIGPQNVTPDPQGRWPYTSLFKTPAGEVRGKSVGYVPEGSGLSQKRYYLPKGGRP